MAKILITGGTGLVGSHLQKKLKENGHDVSILSHDKKKSSSSVFFWDADKHIIDPAAVTQAEIVIHLAGAGIADHRWTKAYKRELTDSRVKSAELLLKTLKEQPNKVHSFISASASGYYGNTGEHWVDELSPQADDFLGDLCRDWEKAAMKSGTLGLRYVVVRTGVVLAREGGALPMLEKQVRLFAGAPLGNGKQYLPWIHIDDLAGIYIHAAENKNVHGVFNASAPGPVQNSFFMKVLSRVLHRPLWFFNVPSAALKLMLGEKSKIVLEGQRMTSQKIREAGYRFHFSEINEALNDIYNTVKS